MNKRGIVEVQLHWVFVMIAGAVILAFFIGIVAKQRAASESNIVFNVKNDLNLLITGSKVSSGIIPLEIYDYEFGFSCNEYTIQNQRQSLLGKPVFAAEKIKGGKILLWSVPWKFPFKIDNILYATSPKIRYIFLGNSDEIYGEIPFSINKVLASDLNALQDEGDYAIRLVVFSAAQGQLYIPNWMKKYEVSAVIVQPQASIYNEVQGNLQFYQYAKNGWTLEGNSKYFTKEGLLGAVFSQNLNDYNCVMANAVAELNAVSNIYLDRIKLIYDTGVCPLFYGTENQFLVSSLASATETKENWQNNVEIMLDAKQKIENLNRDIQYQSCPVIY